VACRRGRSTPVLIPGDAKDLASLERAVAVLERRGRSYLADAILDPIHFGFTDSIARYHALRRACPDAPIMMGIGNVTELTHADTIGMNALLFGIASELGLAAVLVVQVSEHARSVVREADVARRIMYAARRENALPKDFRPPSSRCTRNAVSPYAGGHRRDRGGGARPQPA
jgi:dihydropteroate synthase